MLGGLFSRPSHGSPKANRDCRLVVHMTRGFVSQFPGNKNSGNNNGVFFGDPATCGRKTGIAIENQLVQS